MTAELELENNESRSLPTFGFMLIYRAAFQVMLGYLMQHNEIPVLESHRSA